MMAEVADLERECEGLEGNDDEQSKTNLAELVHEFEKHQDSLKEVISNMDISQYTFIQHIRGAFGKFLAWSFISVTNLQTLSCLVSF